MIGKIRLNLLNEFVTFAVQFLEIKNKPLITLKTERDGLKTYAHFEYGNGKKPKIATYIKNRSLADIMRSIAHELVHCKQLEDGELENPSGFAPSSTVGEKPQDIGGKIEDDANAIAGQLVKAFGYSHNNIYE